MSPCETGGFNTVPSDAISPVTRTFRIEIVTFFKESQWFICLVTQLKFHIIIHYFATSARSLVFHALRWTVVVTAFLVPFLLLHSENESL